MTKPTRSFFSLALCLLASCTSSQLPSPYPPVDLAVGPPPDMTDCGDDGTRDMGGSCLHAVSGKVVDDKGQAIPSLPVTVCAGQCFFGKTAADGSFTVSINYYVQPDQYALVLHAAPRWAAYYLALPPLNGGYVTYKDPVVLLPLPQDGPVIARDKTAQTVTAAGVTLTIPAGTTVFLSPEDAADLSVGERFRPLLVKTPEKVPFLPAGPPPLALYAFGPFEVVFSQPVQVSFPNTTGLLKGDQVDLLEQRGLLNGPPPGAPMDNIGTGQVSADGTRIEMMPGTGTKTLTWIAIRKKGT